VLELKNITKAFKTPYSDNITVAADDVSINVGTGETVGLIGESGCGKTTLALIAMKLLKPDSGSIIIDGEDVSKMNEKKYRSKRRTVQMVFQNPIASMDPIRTVRWSLDEAYSTFGKTPDYEEMFKKFEVPIDVLDRVPLMVSGGEMQRASIMRGLASSPKYLILDEPTSMLDVSIQASIMKTLGEYKNKDRGFLLITHDLDLANCFCDRIYIMHEGKIIEEGLTEDVMKNPKSEVGRKMISAYMEH